MGTKHKLTEANLDIEVDSEFIDSLLKLYGVKADPHVRQYLLDLAYTFARNQLVEARRFANLSNKSCIGVNDLNIGQMEETEDFQFRPLQLTQTVISTVTNPSSSTSLMLPPWRSCHLGVNAKLKQLVAESEANSPPKVPSAAPQDPPHA